MNPKNSNSNVGDYVIYKLYCLDNSTNLIYVGSTSNLAVRRCNHRCLTYNVKSKTYNSSLYSTIREHGGFENWDMVIVEELKNCAKIEALKREEFHRVALNATLNKKLCYSTATSAERTQKWRAENPEKNKEINRRAGNKYYSIHREEVLQKLRDKKKIEAEPEQKVRKGPAPMKCRITV